MTDEQRLRAIIKRDKEITTALFMHAITKRENRVREKPYNYDSNNKKVSVLKIGKSRPRVGKMVGGI